MGLDMFLYKRIQEEAGYWRKANAIHKWFVENVQDGNDDCGDYFVSQEKLERLLFLCKKVKQASKLVDGKIQNGSIRAPGGEWEPIMEDGKYIEDPNVAKELLPTTEGFFFGSTDYNQYYLQDIEETIEILERAIAEGGDYYYHSSW
jgi:hypothetical protein